MSKAIEVLDLYRFGVTASELRRELEKVGYPDPEKLANWLLSKAPEGLRRFEWPGVGITYDNYIMQYEIHYGPKGELMSIEWRVSSGRYHATDLKWSDVGGWRVEGWE